MKSWILSIILIVGISSLVYWENNDGGFPKYEIDLEMPQLEKIRIHQLETEKVYLQKRIQELVVENKAKDVKLKSIKYVIAQYEQQLKALRDSVPSQPVILKALHDESKTPAGFKAAVTRNFGSEIAGRIEVR